MLKIHYILLATAFLLITGLSFLPKTVVKNLDKELTTNDKAKSSKDKANLNDTSTVPHSDEKNDITAMHNAEMTAEQKSKLAMFSKSFQAAKENNKTLIDILNHIYADYGLYQEDLISITLKGKDGLEKMNLMMTHLRNNPPQKLNDQQVIEVKDYQTGESKDANGKVKEKIDLPSSNVLEFNLADGTRVTARPSGTEPKIKFYFSVNTKTEMADIDKNTALLKEKLNSLKKEFEKIVSQF